MQRFYLAGNPENEHQVQGQRGRHSQQQQQQPFARPGGRGGGSACDNIFCGFDAELLAEAFNVDMETARRLQNENDNRNNIVRVEGRLQVVRPPRRQSGWEREGESERERHRYGRRSSRRETEWWRPSRREPEWERETEWERERPSPRRETEWERERRPSPRRETEWERERERERYQGRGGRGGRCDGLECNGNDNNDNGIDETLCTMRLRENIQDPARADIYTRQAGHISTLNSHNLPILSWLQLSAEYGRLHQDAIMGPHWNLNAHSVIYALRGRARIQVVDNNGQAVFDEELQQGRILVVPQNFAVVKRAENEEFEWVSFKTSDNAMINPLAGRTSVMRALPDEVIANAYQISREDARRLKYSRKESTLFRAASGSMIQRRAEA
ncbi:11S globulin-like isoform X2 [Punica granatum]|uniref:11S globulin-like isoform X2 n=1 Tax=Punica granatum TaxID=22663 RepID=A0A6P8C5K6_PUNGR|nr:11S globulin-like isoform X2 [Punica granatum]